MSVEKSIKKRICYILFGWVFALLALVTPIAASTPVFAEPETTTTETVEVETPSETEESEPESTPEESQPEESETTTGTIAISDFNGDICKQNLGAVGWLVCPTMNVVSTAVDSLYSVIKDLLVIKPLVADESSPIYIIWTYCLSIANIVFVIFLLVVVFSQVTGIGITNYGIKKVLPKLIVAAILINISFIICTLAVDVSNIIGSALRSIFESVPITIGELPVSEIPMQDVVGMVMGTTAIAGIAVVASAPSLWMLIPTILAGLASVVSGLITIALRQTVVTLLVMISPLAFICNMLPNTKVYFSKWKDLFRKMLVFYPLFSLLFGASSLAGWAIIASASNNPDTGMLMVVLGLGVQIMPLFFSWSLMKMSGTFLGEINAKIRGLADKPIAANRAWAESRVANSKANRLANGTTPSAYLQRFMMNRKALLETDTKNATAIAENRTRAYVQRKLSGVDIAEETGGKKIASRYTRNAKLAKNYDLISRNMEANTEHVLSNYNRYYDITAVDKHLNEQSANAFVDYARSNFVREVDDENDIDFLTNKFLIANKRDANDKPIDEEAFKRYVATVGGVNGLGEQRVIAKVIAQAARVESKQRAEYSVLFAKYGLNGDNKAAYRNWLTGYYVNDDGWATDEYGNRLKDDNGNYLELVRGELLKKDPSKLHWYKQKDANGLYFDMKDQNGSVIARVYRGQTANGDNNDDAAFIKEVSSNYDIPIGDPINDVYGILAGIKPGDIKVAGAENVGLSRYSTTFGRALSSYKGNAAWAGSMFLSEVGNRQIKNPAQYAIAVLDSIVKTLKPGSFNVQNPASVEYLNTILDPRNWDRIFTEDQLKDAVNINNELVGGEEWLTGENGEVLTDEKGNIKYKAVEGEPTYEQRMNKIKRKYLIPAARKILPAFDVLRTSNTADNQKPGTADKQYEMLEMFETQWLGNDKIPVDLTLITQDLPNKAREFRDMKHDKDGNPIYYGNNNNRRTNGAHNSNNGNNGNRVSANNNKGETANAAQELEYLFDSCMDPESYMNEIWQHLDKLADKNSRYQVVTQCFEDFCTLNPNATMNQIRDEIENEIIPMIYANS